MDSSNIEPLMVLTIGDHHFKTTNVKESLEFCEKIYDLLDKENIDIVVNMGDTLDRHENIHVIPLTNSIKFTKNIIKKKPLYKIIGNHDRPNNNDFLSDNHPFYAMHDTPNLTIVDKVLVEEIKGMKFAFVPYVHPGRLFEALDTNKETKVDSIKDIKVFFGHQEIYGTNMGVVVSTIGDKWPLNYPHFISGHIHDYVRPQDNVTYVGTPMQHAFGDRDDKTVSIWNIYPDKAPLERRIDLGLTKRKIVTLKSNEVINWVPPTGYLTKLVIEGSNSEIKAIMKLEYIKTLTKKGVKIVYNTIDEINIGTNKKINFQDIKLSYSERLKGLISNSKIETYWFNKIFSNNL